ncbi:HAMP domain-containing sensor histidine kinase [Paenibacillus sp. YN15]|uniref:sensor histidine kinase n=1 Tax=Paenibacillus sp. YN15 TaxID=1742774 RepID=UPI000DCEB2BA|nr:HAMP domain-containing sensor histidine kinase [Paenibacillus sp. YN15]RAU96121.1 ATP-binding protein [Paenibacillus sp. YN15]
MPAVLIILWTVGLVLLVFDPRKPSVRWMAGFLFCGGAGALSAVIGDTIMPYGALHGYSREMLDWLDRARIVSSLTQYYGLPFTFIMFASHYNPAPLPAALRRALPYAVLAPLAFILLTLRPVHPIPFRAVVFWAVPVVAAGAYLVLSRRETLYLLRRNHRYTAAAIVPAVLYCSVMNYLLPALGFTEMWRYNTWAIVLAFIIFIIAIFKYGFLDMQFLITKKKLDISLRAVTSGTAVLNHAIKNDVGKMKLFTAKIAAFAADTNQPELLRDIRVIEAAAEHIQEMIARVKGQTQELVLRQSALDLGDVLEELSHQVSLGLPASVEARWELDGPLPLTADRAQLVETVQNLVNNALEAMPEGGELLVRAYQTPKWVVVEVRDTGKGISREELKRVLEPFYTTKAASNRNFGLGLSYCYHVMKLHKGNLHLESTPGKGTTATIHFPKRKEERHGAHSVIAGGG